MDDSLKYADISHRIGWRAFGALALCWCASLHAGQIGQPVAAGDITSITLERNCFGCASGSVLVLSSDGNASLTISGSARQGTESKVLRGRVGIEAFRRVARLASAQGFFSMNDSYEDPSIRDGAWSTLALGRGSDVKQVFSREDAGPPGLKVLAEAIDQTARGIAFAP